MSGSLAEGSECPGVAESMLFVLLKISFSWKKVRCHGRDNDGQQREFGRVLKA